MKVIAAVGDYYHDVDLFKKAFSNVLSNIADLDLEFVPREELIEKLEGKPDVVVLASENRLNPDEEEVNTWLTESDEMKITNYVNNGGSWFAWHSGLASYETNSSYIDMLGGHFTHHPDDHVNVRYDFKGDHELTKGKKSFEIIDEHYFIKSDKDISIFLTSTSEHGESVAGWTKSYGEGKICCYTPAHNKEGLMHAAVQSDLTHIVNWLAGSEAVGK